MNKKLLGFMSVIALAGIGEYVRAQSNQVDTSKVIETRPPIAPVVVEKDPKPESSPEVSADLPATPLDSVPIDKLNENLRKLDRFAKLDNSTHQVTFDSKAAKEAGFDNEEIKLAEELYQHQNQLVSDLKSGKTQIGAPNTRPDSVKFPRYAKFRARVSEQAKTKGVDSQPKKLTLLAANTETACGNYSYPKPNVTPPRYYYNMSDPEGWLKANGFRLTPSYAAYGGTYGYRWTRPSYYTGVQGTCDSPKFRDDGIRSQGATYKDGYLYNMTLQGLAPQNAQTEPNPEIFESYYGYWPYSAWGEYVNWWHRTY